MKLHLVRAGVVHISWLDERGLPYTELLTTWVRTDRREWIGWKESGELSVFNAPPGVYAALAVTGEGRAALIRDLVLRPGEQTRIQVATEPAGTIMIVGLEPGEVAVLVAGDAAFPATLGDARFRVPAGVYGVQRVPASTISAADAPGPIECERLVTVHAGALVTVDLR